LAKRDRLKICVNHRQSLGFTLIEQLVALLIVAVLSAIALPSFLNQRDKAEVAHATLIAQSFVVPLLEYRLRHGNFPPDTNANVAPVGLEDVWVAAAAAPMRSPFDYEHHGLGNGSGGGNGADMGQCLIMITWFGKNQIRDPATSVYSAIASGDDVIVRVATYDCDQPRRSIR